VRLAIRPAPGHGRLWRLRGTEGIETLGQTICRGDGRIHPVGLRNCGLEGLGQHEIEELVRKLWLIGCSQLPGNLDLQVVTFVEKGGGLAGIAFRDQMVGGRRGVAEDHVRLAFEKQAVSLGPAGGDGDDVVSQAGPDVRRLVAVSGLDPEEKAKARGGRARVLDHDLEVGGSEGLEGFGRFGELGLVVDEGEPAPVEGQEQRAGEVDRQVEFRRFAMRRKAGVEAEDNVSVGGRPFQLDAGEKGRAVTGWDELQVAGAGGLEGFLYDRAGTPFRGEAVVGQNGEDRRLGQRGGGDGQKARNKEVYSHHFLHGATDWSGMENPCTFPPPV
jgi:hypothetical protein